MLTPFAIFRIVAVVGTVLAAVLLLAAHRRRPDLPSREASLSTYFVGRARPLMVGAYAALAVALAAVAGVLAAGDLAALFSATACVLAALLLFPVVMTTPRDAGSVLSERRRLVHRHSAVAAFGAIGLAMGATAASPSAGTPLAILSLLGAGLAWLVLASGPSSTYGLKQKGLVACVCAWIVVIAACDPLGTGAG